MKERGGKGEHYNATRDGRFDKKKDGSKKKSGRPWPPRKKALATRGPAEKE